MRKDMKTDRFCAESHIRQMTTNDATGTVFTVIINGHSAVSIHGKRPESAASRTPTASASRNPPAM